MRWNETIGTVMAEGEEKPNDYPTVFAEDVVAHVDDSWWRGLVTKVAGQSDDEMDDELDEEEDDEEGGALPTGHSRVQWIRSSYKRQTRVESLQELVVVDRAFLHGDIVASSSDPLGQTGTVVDVRVKMNLEIGNSRVSGDSFVDVVDICPQEVQHLNPFCPGLYVVRDRWLGRVEEALDNVTVQFDDGSQCKVFRASPENLLPKDEYDDQCPYYPSQRVTAPPALFRRATWLVGSFRNRSEGVVIAVEPSDVTVTWMACGMCDDNGGTAGEREMPPAVSDPSDLKTFGCFQHTWWQVGDRCLYLTDSRADSEGQGSGEAGEGTANATDGSGCVQAADAGTVMNNRRRMSKRRRMQRQRTGRRGPAPVKCAQVVDMSTRVDVVWQDGSREEDVAAINLVPVAHLQSHDFWPEDYVMLKPADDEAPTTIRKTGVVTRVDAKARTCYVRWLPDEDGNEECEELMSMYEVLNHPEYSYRLGDVVLRLPAEKGTEDSESGSEGSNVPSIAEEKDAVESDGCDDSKEGVREDWVGEIVRLDQGQIDVVWLDGSRSMVKPEAIYVVHSEGEEDWSGSEYEGEESDWETVDEDEEGRPVEEIDEAEEGLLHNSRVDDLARESEMLDREGLRSVEDNLHVEFTGAFPRARSHSAPVEPMSPQPEVESIVRQIEAVITGDVHSQEDVESSIVSERVADMKSPGLASQGQQSDLADYEDEEVSSPFNIAAARQPEPSLRMMMSRMWSWVTRKAIGRESVNREDLFKPVSPSAVGLAAASDSTSYASRVVHRISTASPQKSVHVTKEAQGHTTATAVASPSCTSAKPSSSADDAALPLEVPPEIFPNFATVDEIPDHYYANDMFSPGLDFIRRVQREWRVLATSLPPNILVRVSESRVDLLRCMMIGPAGTPYQDGLYVFDIQFPSQYPLVPPNVSFLSYGERINPNLYENGKVCLSLLGTWSGKGNENWSAASSNVLQLLVSIIGLVLNSEPYYNEAGYEKQIGTSEGAHNSRLYNESVMLLSLQFMVRMIRLPPLHFEEFVIEHFKRRAPIIKNRLQKCLADSNGGDMKDEAGLKFPTSEGFRRLLVKKAPNVVSVLDSLASNSHADATNSQ